MSENLVRLRREAGLTQEQLARKMGVGVDAIRKWERGRRTPALDLGFRLADALECNIYELAGREPPPPRRRRRKREEE
jgi:transcriptional regulator with XRE-family HTH domain